MNPREKLIAAGAEVYTARVWPESGPPNTEDRGDVGCVLDAFLAHPDDLIALLVEMGALDPTAIHCDDGSLILLGPDEKVMSGDVVLYRRAPEGSHNDG